MHRIKIVLCVGVLLFNSLPNRLGGQEIKKDGLGEYRRAGLSGGNPAKGKTLFESDKVGCTKCNVVQGTERLAGPELRFIGDKYGREQLVESVLEPNATKVGDGPDAIPESNPYRNAGPSVRPEIWASGLRNPWRFSFDPLTAEFWVGDVGQYLFEEVSIVRPDENHGWNVHEGFLEFSNQFRRPGEKYTPPVFAYRRRHGVSVTGGPVYRGKRNPSYYGAYLFEDFESKRIWALTQANRQLIGVAQIGMSPERIASFGVDADGELLLVGYEGTIFRLVLDGSDFAADPQRKARVTLLRAGVPTAARASIKGGDNKPHAPAGAAIRKTKRDESYFYALDRVDVELPPGRARLSLSGGIETIPQTVTLDADTNSELTVQVQPWIDMAARGWYSGDSHVHLHTGGSIAVTLADAIIAARAEGVNYVNLCVSNSVGDDIRDAELITGKPHAVSTDGQLLVFGEEMRSTIYGHMQFFGINRLVEPQFTGFDETPNHFDFPANHVMAAEAVRQGGVVTNGPIPSLVVNGKGPGETCELPAAAIAHAAVTVESYVPFNKIEVLVNGKVAAHDEVGLDERAGIRVRRFDVDLPIDRSSWIAVRVRGPEHPHVFDGPPWRHTSPVYIQVAGQRIASPEDAAYFVEWIEQMLRVVAARNRYARVEERRQVEALFRRAQQEFRRMTERR